MNTASEIWKDVPGYEGYYQVSDLGRIRSVDREVRHRWGGTQTRKGLLLAPKNKSAGTYFRVTLRRYDDLGVAYSRDALVHRLVLCAFTGEPLTNQLDVDHIDGDKRNNTLGNLRWATRQVNNRNKHKATGVSRHTGVHFDSWETGKKNPWRAQAVIDGKTISLGRYPTEDEAARARKKFEADNNLRPGA